MRSCPVQALRNATTTGVVPMMSDPLATLVRVTHGNRIFKLEDFADSVEFFEAVEDYVCPILIDLLDGNEMDALGNVYGLPGSGIFEPCGRQRLEDWSATRRAARARR